MSRIILSLLGLCVGGLLSFTPSPLWADVLMEPEDAPFLALSPQSLQELDQLALEILRQYPPLEYDYMALGTSPSLLAEVLKRRIQTLGDDTNILWFPLSLPRGPLTAPQLENLDQHLQARIIRKERLTKRPLVVIDFVVTGKTLHGFGELASHWQKNGLMTRPVHIAAIHHEDFSQTVIPSRQVTWFEVGQHLNLLFLFRAFKQFSPYRSWRPAREPTPYEPPTILSDNDNHRVDRYTGRAFNRKQMKMQLNLFFNQETSQTKLRLCSQVHRL